jgi:glucosamine--fructose-6-phosphate aminotransferase (isomerizing)
MSSPERAHPDGGVGSTEPPESAGAGSAGTGAGTQPGALFLREILEQPNALRALLEHDDEYARVAAAARERGRLVRFVGHGSSDNAATYGVYAFGLLAGWTAMRDSIALTVYFGAEPEMSNSTVVALSQSGRTPDVVEYVRKARRAGAFTIALTNDVTSELAQEAEAVLPLAAGEERAVAATKTYLNQVAALALLAGHCGGKGPRVASGIREVAEQLDGALPVLESQARGLAAPFAYVGRMLVIGRGPEFATAREIALKLLETCKTAAWPLTATDLAHGPVAVLDPLFPVWAIASRDETLPAVQEAVARVREFGGTIVASGDAANAIEGAQYFLPVPEPKLPILSPLLSVVPGQLFAAALAHTKGFDPDRPRGLSKVTLAR